MKTLNIVMTFLMLTAALFAMAPFAEADSSNVDRDFVRQASVANLFEVESSKLALEKSKDPDIRAFAQQMIDDHTKSGAELKETIPASTVSEPQIAMELDPKHEKIMGTLIAAEGAAFDREYVKAQRDAHKEAVDLFSSYSKNAKDSRLKAFALKTLPTLEKHKAHVDSLKPAM